VCVGGWHMRLSTVGWGTADLGCAADMLQTLCSALLLHRVKDSCGLI